MITAAAFLFWFAEFVLESLGSFRIFRFRRELISIWLYLAFRALADVITFAIRLRYGWNAYSWADWAQRLIQYLFLLVIAGQVCGRLASERNRRKVIFGTVVLSLKSAVLIGWLFCAGETLKDRLLDGALAADFIVMIAIVLAWLGRNKKLEHPWNAIGAALLVQFCSDAILTAAWLYWDHAHRFMPLGEIAALIVWITLPAWKEIRLELGPRLSASCYGDPEKVVGKAV